MFKNIFETKVYYSKLDFDICNKAKLHIDNKQNEFQQKTWDCDIKTSLNYSPNILNSLELHELKMNILSHLEMYMYQNNKFIDGYIYDSWVNIYEKDFFQEFHVHTHDCYKSLSGIVYLTENNSEIIFNIDNPYNFIPKFADILIFPDDVPHRVRKNTNDNLRVSLAFNFKLCNLSKITSLK